jgi:sirohydrochlorin ferrochelatase
MRHHLSRFSRDAAEISTHLSGHPPVADEETGTPGVAPFNRDEASPSSFSSTYRTGRWDGPLVGTATLELNAKPLAQQIVEFAQQALLQGVRQLVVIPLFLLEGIHVKEDLPEELTTAKAQLPSRIRLQCLPYLGGQERFKQYVRDRLMKTTAEGCILLAHGSRRPAGNRLIQQLGTELAADVAFWKVAPDLETQVYDVMRRGHQRIAIAPYFLFPGSITDAITHRTEELAERFPKLSLRLLSPLGTSADLGKAIGDWVLQLPHGLPSAAWPQPSNPVAKSSITA